MCPVALWDAYVAGSPLLKKGGLRDRLPAYHLANGSPAKKSWMVAKTRRLCEKAGVRLLDDQGKLLPLKMASWRAGGVRSAKDASLSDYMIMELGRWKSVAWQHYVLHTALDVQGAARSMWQAVPSREVPRESWVSELRVVEMTTDLEEIEEDACIVKLASRKWAARCAEAASAAALAAGLAATQAFFLVRSL